MGDPTRLGPYRILRTLARGGMGKIYQGVNEETGEAAAVKVLFEGLSVDPDFRQRFEGEIEALKRLRHPNIVRLFGFGQQEEILFYAMELVEGASLEEELARGRRFGWREVARIAVQTCHALRHAHDRGIIHRDIKPANLLLTAQGQVKLSDFGIARLFGTTGRTAAGNVLGTAEYMAPEQADARPVGPRTDLYSLGGVLFALLAGRPPFQARSVAQMLQKHRSVPPEPVTRFNTTVPAELEQIIGQLMEKRPEDRIATALALSRRLEAMLHALPEEPASLGPVTKPGAAGEEEPAEGGAEPADAAPTQEMTGWAERPAPAAEPDVPLAETQETSAFDIYAVREPEPEEPAPAVPTRGRFVAVGDEELDRVERPPSQDRVWVTLQTWVLAAALVAVGLGVWYLLQPPSADALYEEIIEGTREGTVASYRRAEEDIQDFLARYPSDRRCEVLREYLTEIDVDRRENRLRLLARAAPATANLLPVESDYLAAIGYARFDPEEAVRRLRALIEFYGGSRTERVGPTGEVLELARRRLEGLEALINRFVDARRTRIQERLDQARAQAATDPEAARRIRESVVILFGDKPWAAEEVARARKALEEAETAAFRGDGATGAGRPPPGDEAGPKPPDSPQGSRSAPNAGRKNEGSHEA